MSDCCVFIHSIKVGKFLLAPVCDCVLNNENVMCSVLGEIHLICVCVFNEAVVVTCLLHKLHFSICTA